MTVAPRSVVVTGGGRGIGRAVAEGLAAEGWRVLVLDLGCLVDGAGTDGSVAASVAAGICDAGGTATSAAVDVTVPSEVDAAIAEAIAAWGTVDAAVNVAGILRTGNLLTTNDDDWDLLLAVHIRGAFNVSRAVVRHWMDRDATFGRIVNVTSAAGLEGGPDMLGYSTAKAGVIGMTLSMASSLADRGYTVNAIAPVAATRMAVRGLGRVALEARAETGVWPDLDDLAPAALVPLFAYLLDDGAAHVTGRVFTNEGWRYAALGRPTEEADLAAATGSTVAEVVAGLASAFACLERTTRTPRVELGDTEGFDFPVAELG